mgnify:CR=1 FL=1
MIGQIIIEFEQFFFFFKDFASFVIVNSCFPENPLCVKVNLVYLKKPKEMIVVVTSISNSSYWTTTTKKTAKSKVKSSGNLFLFFGHFLSIAEFSLWTFSFHFSWNDSPLHSQFFSLIPKVLIYRFLLLFFFCRLVLFQIFYLFVHFVFVFVCYQNKNKILLFCRWESEKKPIDKLRMFDFIRFIHIFGWSNIFSCCKLFILLIQKN